MKTLFRPRFIEGKNSSPDEPSAGNEFSSAIGKHSSDSSRGVKVVRHRVAPFDIFPRAHATFSRITIGTREEKRILRSEKLLYIYIYISFLETSTKRRGRAFSGEFRWKEEEKKRKKRSSWWPSRSTSIHGDWIVWESLRGGMSRNVETSRLLHHLRSPLSNDPERNRISPVSRCFRIVTVGEQVIEGHLWTCVFVLWSIHNWWIYTRNCLRPEYLSTCIDLYSRGIIANWNWRWSLKWVDLYLDVRRTEKERRI